MSDGSIYWAYVRWEADNLPKFVFISWCGEGVTGQTKGKFSAQALDMKVSLPRVTLLLSVCPLRVAGSLRLSGLMPRLDADVLRQGGIDMPFVH